jgi:hypothetical protein
LHHGESERGERDAVSPRVAFYAGLDQRPAFGEEQGRDLSVTSDLLLLGRWLGPTCNERELHLRIEPRPDGKPRLIEVASLALALDNAARQIVER